MRWLHGFRRTPADFPDNKQFAERFEVTSRRTFRLSNFTACIYPVESLASKLLYPYVCEKCA